MPTNTLTKERLTDLKKYREENNKEALKSLILRELNRIKIIAGKYTGNGIEFDELVSIAVETTINVIKNYDYNTLGITYFRNYIDTAINVKLKNIIQDHLIELKMKVSFNSYDGIKEDYLFEQYLDNITNEKINSVLDTFEADEKELIEARYGINGVTIKTLEQLSKERNMTYEGIRKRELRILKKIKKRPSLYKQLDYLIK